MDGYGIRLSNGMRKIPQLPQSATFNQVNDNIGSRQVEVCATPMSARQRQRHSSKRASTFAISLFDRYTPKRPAIHFLVNALILEKRLKIAAFVRITGRHRSNA
jgi:hypothetical protein